MQSIDDVLQKEILTKLVQKAKYLNRLDQLLHHALDHELKQHCHCRDFQGGLLSIECETSAWTTRLRFHVPQLRVALKDRLEFHGLEEIKCFTRPKAAHLTVKAKSRKTQPLSEENSSMLAGIAESIENEKLRKALQKLALNK